MKQIVRWCSCGLLFGGLLAASPIGATEITPAARKDIAVSPPPKDEIVVPEQYRGLHEVKPNYGEPYTADFTLQYQSGFLRGWQDFIERFQTGNFDLDEALDPARFPDDFVTPVSTGGASAYPPGQVAGARACREELLALAEKRDLTFLPARPPWLKKFIALGGSDPGLDETGKPAGLFVDSAQAQKITDDDLKLFQEIPMAEMRRLNLRFTLITDAGVANLPAMPHLTHLEISAKNLTGACFRTLNRFPRLTTLEIVGPRGATADDLAAVKKLSALESINLCAVEIEDETLPVFLALPNLTDLRLDWAYDGSRGAKLSSGAIARLGGCSRLKVLGLSGCAVDDATLRALAAGLPELWSLSLASTLVTDESMGSIQKLPKLEWLRLSHSRVTDVGIAALASHPSLRTLLLDDTRISDQTLATLATLPKIKEICVRRGQFSEAGTDAFKKLKPEAYVIRFN